MKNNGVSEAHASSEKILASWRFVHAKMDELSYYGSTKDAERGIAQLLRSKKWASSVSSETQTKYVEMLRLLQQYHKDEEEHYAKFESPSSVG